MSKAFTPQLWNRWLDRLNNGAPHQDHLAAGIKRFRQSLAETDRRLEAAGNATPQQAQRV